MAQNKTQASTLSVDAHLAINGFGVHRYPLASGKLGKRCLYITRLADIDLAVLTQLVRGAFEARHAV